MPGAPGGTPVPAARTRLSWWLQAGSLPTPPVRRRTQARPRDPAMTTAEVQQHLTPTGITRNQGG